MAWITALAIGSTALSIYGQNEQRKENAKAARRKAAIQRMQAKETLRRFEVEKTIIELQSENFKATQAAISAAQGGRSTGSYIQMEQTAKNVSREIYNLSREAEFRADQILRGADFTEQVAEDQENASFINMFSTALSGASTILKNKPGSTEK